MLVKKITNSTNSKRFYNLQRVKNHKIHVCYAKQITKEPQYKITSHGNLDVNTVYNNCMLASKSCKVSEKFTTYRKAVGTSQMLMSRKLNSTFNVPWFC